MYVLGKSILFMKKSGKYGILSPHPHLEIYQQNGIMALRMSRLFNLVYIKHAWHRAIVLHYTTSCWSGTPWDTLWETQCHRSDSGLHHRDLSDLLNGHYLILDKMRGTSNKTFSSCMQPSLLSEHVSVFERASRNQNWKTKILRTLNALRKILFVHFWSPPLMIFP